MFEFFSTAAPESLAGRTAVVLIGALCFVAFVYMLISVIPAWYASYTYGNVQRCFPDNKVSNANRWFTKFDYKPRKKQQQSISLECVVERDTHPVGFDDNPAFANATLADHLVNYYFYINGIATAIVTEVIRNNRTLEYIVSYNEKVDTVEFERILHAAKRHVRRLEYANNPYVRRFTNRDEQTSLFQ